MSGYRHILFKAVEQEMAGHAKIFNVHIEILQLQWKLFPFLSTFWQTTSITKEYIIKVVFN
jgi:hypothetical protein